MADDTHKIHLHRRALLAQAPALLAAAAACTREPDLRPGESGAVARVSDGDLIALDTGLRVRLAEIEAPSPFGEGDPFGEEARALLEREALGRRASLFYGGLSRDRYERALAHVFVEDEVGRSTWLNGLMVRQGAARVRTYPDNAAKVRDLYTLESEARDAGRGLWALDAYRVRTRADWPTESEPRAFTIAQGVLAAIDPPERYGVARMTAAGLRIAPPETLASVDGGPALAAGQQIRIRGRTRIHDDESVTIDFSHWAQVEALAE